MIYLNTVRFSPPSSVSYPSSFKPALNASFPNMMAALGNRHRPGRFGNEAHPVLHFDLFFGFVLIRDGCMTVDELLQIVGFWIDSCVGHDLDQCENMLERRLRLIVDLVVNPMFVLFFLDFVCHGELLKLLMLRPLVPGVASSLVTCNFSPGQFPARTEVQ